MISIAPLQDHYYSHTTTNPNTNPNQPSHRLNRVQTKNKIFLGGIWTCKVPFNGQQATIVATELYMKLRY